MALTMRVQKQASLARAQPAKARVSRRNCVVVNASKKSVGDLSEADLKGKAVFVRAGEQLGGDGMGCLAAAWPPGGSNCGRRRRIGASAANTACWAREAGAAGQRLHRTRGCRHRFSWACRDRGALLLQACSVDALPDPRCPCCFACPADLNVPLDKEQKITDDTRIRAAVPTLKYLLDKGAKVLLTSHLVRVGRSLLGLLAAYSRAGGAQRSSRSSSLVR